VRAFFEANNGNAAEQERLPLCVAVLPRQDTIEFICVRFSATCLSVPIGGGARVGTGAIPFRVTSHRPDEAAFLGFSPKKVQ